MQIALTLLISAMQLLGLVQTNPQLPQSFKENAIVVANQAITFAQIEIAKNQSSTIQPVVPTQPSFGSITPSQPVATILEVEDLNGNHYGGGCQTLYYRLRVLDQNGNEMSKEQFYFTPQEISGSIDKVFTSKGLYTTRTINLTSFRTYIFDANGNIKPGIAFPPEEGSTIIRTTNGEKFDTATNKCL